jgi:iron(III) transport system substrate-binding protein
MIIWNQRALRLWISVALVAIGGCGGRDHAVVSGSPRRVVVYSALDREFAEPVLKAYAQEARVEVAPKFDVESTKTVGLTDLPDAFKAKDETWYGFAARARILLVNTKLVAEANRPKGIKDLLDPKWKGRIGIAKPLFGTTATHAACLFAAWGDEKARSYFRDLKANGVQVLSGNKQVATAVGSGQLVFGLTDTDDAMGEVEAGSPVTIIYPDREPKGLGTLFIPNTLAIIKGSPNPEGARALASHLISPEVEAILATGPSAQIPLLRTTEVSARVETPRTVHAMDVNFEDAVKLWDHVAAFLADMFAGD